MVAQNRDAVRLMSVTLGHGQVDDKNYRKKWVNHKHKPTVRTLQWDDWKKPLESVKTKSKHILIILIHF